MTSTFDDEGTPLFTEGSLVRDALRDARAALESTKAAPQPKQESEGERDARRPMTFSRRQAIAERLCIPHDRKFVDILRAVEAEHGIAAEQREVGN